MAKAKARTHGLSPEVVWYLESRGYGLPKCFPKFHTPEPRRVKGAVFDAGEVDRKIAALKHLRHTKGRWAGQPIIPTSEQVAYIIAPIFGWKHPSEDEPDRLIRIIRDAYVEMSRKGAKTTLVAALGMTLAFADGEGGAEVYFGAASKDQARNAFQPLKAVAAASPMLKAAGVRALASDITQDSTSSFIKVVSSQGELAHGSNVHGALVDELHVHKNGSLLEALESGTGARSQPLIFIITTADDGKTTSIYAQRREMIEKLSKGVYKNPYQYGVIFAADDNDDPFAEETIAKANPLYPVTPSREFMRSAVKKAQTGGPVALASYLRLHLGIRSGLATALFDMRKWDLNRGNGWADIKDLAGRTAYGGLDLANVSDLTCLAWLVKDPDRPGYDVLLRSFIPEESLPALDSSTDRNASAWVQQGWLTVTPGDVTDYNFIKAQALADAQQLDVYGIGYDRWNSSQLVIDLAEEGLPMEKVGQGYASLSAPLKELDRLHRLGARNRGKEPLLRHAGNPVLKWNADNLRPAKDPASNLKPDKTKSMNKIDGMVALTIAMSVALTVEAPLSSAYENAGVEVV